MNKYILGAGLVLALSLNANAAQYTDLVTDNAPIELEPTPPAVVTGDKLYDYDMGATVEVFDEAHFDPSETILNRVWVQDESISVRLRVNMETLISLPPEEHIQGVIVGDPVGFLATTMGDNVITVTPVAHDIESNLILIGEEGRIYTFHLRSGKKIPEYVPHFAVNISLGLSGEVDASEVVLSGANLPDEIASETVQSVSKLKGKALRLEQERLKKESLLRKLTKKDYDFLATLEAAEIVNTKYKIFGEKAIAPNAVWDDGKITYISFRNGTPSQRLPVLYRIIDGYATTANSHYRDGFIIADSVSDEGWMLIDGERVVCIQAPDYSPKTGKELVKLKNLVNEEG